MDDNCMQLSFGVNNEDLGTVFLLNANNFQTSKLPDIVDGAYSLYV